MADNSEIVAIPAPVHNNIPVDEYHTNFPRADSGEMEQSIGSNASSASSMTVVHTALRPVLEERHINMIALNGTIGVGLFVNTGPILSAAGPLGALISYVIVGLVSSSVLASLGEMTAMFPVEGPLYEFPTRFLDSSVGFAVGWMFWIVFVLTTAAELTVSASLMGTEYDNVFSWNTGTIAIWIIVFLTVMIAINMLPVKIFGELEYWFGVTKLYVVVALIIACVAVADKQAGYRREDVGAYYWNKPYGAFASNYTHVGETGSIVYMDNEGRLFSMWTAMTLVVWSYIGLEIIAVTAAETSTPETNRSPETIKIATRKIAIRVITLYCFATFLVSFCVPYNDPRLQANEDLSASHQSQTSPFVLAFVLARVKVLPSILNGIFVWSALSAGTNALYVASRTLHALSLRRQVWPVFLMRRLQKTGTGGVPHAAVLLCAAPSLLAFLACGNAPLKVFHQLIRTGTVAHLIVSIVICLTFIRFQRRLEQEYNAPQTSERWRFNRADRRYPYRTHLQPARAYFGLIASSLFLLFNGWSYFLTPHVKEWFGYVVSSYISIIVFAILVAGNKIYNFGWLPWNWRMETLEVWEDMVYVSRSERRGQLEITDDKISKENIIKLGRWLWEWTGNNRLEKMKKDRMPSEVEEVKREGDSSTGTVGSV